MAQGNYGTSDNPLEEIHGEQVVYEPLMSDPSDREEGAVWFRADMDSGDKVGTFRIQNDDAGTDIDDWPAFAEGDTVDGVVKVLPVQTQNGEAFVPYQQEGGAFDQLRFQHNGTWYGAHNSLTAIPASVVNRWPIKESSGTTAEDVVGNRDLTLNTDFFASDANAIEGQILDPNGGDDGADNNSATSPTGSMTMAVTLEFSSSISDGQVVFAYEDGTSSGDDVRAFRFLGSNSINWQAFPGTGDTYGTSHGLSTNTRYRVVGVLDTPNNEIRLYVNDTLQDTTATGGESFGTGAPAVTVAYRQSDNDRFFGGLIDEPMVADEAWTASDVTDDYNRQPWS